MTAESRQQEWRQYRLLARDGVRTLLNTAMLGRDGDPMQFAIWTTALVATPPALFAFGQLFKYSSLRNAPGALIERIVLADRMFFIVYTLIAAALLAAMTWEALYPDREDQEIIGALPVRPRTATAARLTAALTIALAFALAINLPSALCFSLVSVSHPSVGILPVVLIAHLLATVCGCVTLFTLLLLLHGIVSLVLGSSVTDRLAAGLQLVTVVALVEVFFYLPSLLPRLVTAMSGRSSWDLWLPSTWFGALYSVLAGPHRTTDVRPAMTGLAMMFSLLILVVPMYLVPARVMARRALESQPAGNRQGHTARLVRRAVAFLSQTRPAGSVAAFALLSLARSRRHMLIVVTYAGVGAALALIQVIASALRGGLTFGTPTRGLLAVPLVMMFFLVAGIRAAFSIPRDLDANWIFRLHSPTPLQAAAGTRTALVVGALAPILGLTALSAQLAGWSISSSLLVMVLDLLFGLLLVESALFGWSIIPFACARSTGHESVQTGWLVALGPFVAFTLGGATLQAMALRSPRVAASVVLASLATWALLSLLRRRRARHDRIPFDGPPAHLEVLNLSEALH